MATFLKAAVPLQQSQSVSTTQQLNIISSEMYKFLYKLKEGEKVPCTPKCKYGQKNHKSGPSNSRKLKSRK